MNPMIERTVAAVIMTMLCLATFVVHSFVIRSFIRRRQLSMPFFVLCFSRSLAHLTSSVTVFLTVVPAMLTNTELFTYWVNYSTVTVVSIFVSELLLALNRFVAVFSWRYYDRIWNIKVTWVLVIVSWIAGISMLAYGISIGCYMEFKAALFISLYPDPSCLEISLDDFLFTPCMGLAIVLNLITFAKILISWRQTRNIQSNVDQRIKENTRQFLFSFSQSIIWMINMLTWIFQLAAVTNKRLLILLLSLGFVMIAQLAEGCIYVAFRRKEVFSSPTSSVAVQKVSIQLRSSR